MPLVLNRCVQKDINSSLYSRSQKYDWIQLPENSWYLVYPCVHEAGVCNTRWLETFALPERRTHHGAGKHTGLLLKPILMGEKEAQLFAVPGGKHNSDF